MLGGLQGRKNVVWLAADLPFDLIPENRNISEAELAADLPQYPTKIRWHDRSRLPSWRTENASCAGD